MDPSPSFLASESSSSNHPPQSDPNPPLTVDPLPTYSDLKDQEGHRFGRWKSWIEKRARERVQEPDEERRGWADQGRSGGTGWDPPEYHPTQDHSAPEPLTQHFHPQQHQQGLDRNSSIISSQNESAAFASAAQHHKNALLRATKSKGFLNPLSATPSRPFLERGPGAINLTPSTSVHQIGSRFLPQFNSQPLCAIPLPFNHSNLPSDDQRVERFLLVGTADGLYVCDLVPALSHTIKTDSVSSTDCKIYKIWDGMGIHQLEIAVEEPNPRQKTPNATAAMSGIVIGLTTQLSDLTVDPNTDGLSKSIKMWPLQSMINLVKFRALSENSECLDLCERTTNSKRMSALSAGTHALAGLKSIFDKGKSKVDHGIMSRKLSLTNPRTTLDPHQSAESFPTKPTTSYLELPLQWAKQFTSLDLPRINAHGPILFIKLARSPIPGFNSLNDAVDGMDFDAIPMGLRSRAFSVTDHDDEDSHDDDLPNDPNHGSPKTLYLIIATKQIIFVLESLPGPKRTWQLCSEMAAPFGPKTVDLISSQFTRPSNQRSSMMSSAPNSRNSVLSTRHNGASIGCGEESVLVTMKEYAVVISLSDLCVREVEFQGAMSTRQSTSAAGQLGNGRKMTGGSLSSLASLDSVQATLMNLPRPGTSSNLASETILTGRRIGEGDGTRDDGFRVDNRRVNRAANDRRWIGCEELLIPVTLPSREMDQVGNPSRNRMSRIVIRSLYLITRGHLTHVVLSPLGHESSVRKRSPRKSEQTSHTANNPVGIPSPIVLKPIHTFTWRAAPVKVRGHIISTPQEWDSRKLPKVQKSSSTDESSSKDELFCCLTAFTSTGIEVQEGFISLDSLRSGWKTHEGTNLRFNRNSQTLFFTPASQHLGRLSNDLKQTMNLTPEHPNQNLDDRRIEKEVTDISSYDYNAKIGFLCDGGAWFSTGEKKDQPNRMGRVESEDLSLSEEDEENEGRMKNEVLKETLQGGFFWKESMGEWKIMYICYGAS
ncbi:hypothetical protein DFH28DRAFT_1027899 [Melampsora americana]|nr:hypothetical protein DFH28DRAFT_1027899 [Melampsora americana]